MEIYLIRHTSLNISEGICYGRSELDLADSFLDEMKVSLDKINLSGKFFVYSSPSKRCLMLAKNLGVENVSVDSRLNELNFGDWELKKWDEIDKDKLDEWMNDFVNVRCPNGESYMDLYERCKDFFNELTEKDVDRIVIVTHGGVIRSFLCHVMDLPLEKSFSLEISQGSVSKIVVKGENKKVEFINR